MTDFKNVPIAEIHPDPNQPRKFFDKGSLDELTESVKKDGVLEPIMIRPSAKGFVIVYGERRFKAAMAAGLEEIPAQIRELSNDEAFEFQITENLHRKDVHPMEEANSYERLQKKDPVKNTVKELATRFAKSESYITQRLSFNKLIPEFQKDFYEGKFSNVHAVLFSRLTTSDQNEIRKSNRLRFYEHYRSSHELNDYIERNITHSLSKAPFDKEDESLNPGAGPCSKCLKRSGCNKLLFADVKETDRCFDKDCFNTKSTASFIRNLLDIIEAKPDIHFLYSRYDKMPPSINKLLQEHKLKPLDGNDYSSHTFSGCAFSLKAKGFHLNGYEAGKFETIYLKGKASGKTKNGKVNEPPAGEVIKGIQAREKRAKELDQEKVWSLLKGEFKPEKHSGNDGDFTPDERNAIAQALYNKLGFQESDAFRKFFKIKDGRREGVGEVDAIKLRQMIRFYMFSILPPSALSGGYNNDALLSLQIARQYFPSQLSKLEKDQQTIADKRAERVAKRILDLKRPVSKKVELPKPKKALPTIGQGVKKLIEDKKVKTPKKKTGKK